MPDFATIKSNISKNLADSGNVFYSSTDINNSVQDAYDDVVVLTQCIIKKVSLPFLTVPYYDFKLYVPDFLATTAIFNNNTNRFLNDNLTVRDFDNIRDNWELWNGSAEYWAMLNFKYTVIVPIYSVVPSQNLDLYYWALAPTVFDENVPLVPTDMHDLIELYSTPDLLEQAEEYAKANEYWKMYFETITVCANRLKDIASTDLIRLA